MDKGRIKITRIKRKREKEKITRERESESVKERDNERKSRQKQRESKSMSLTCRRLPLHLRNWTLSQEIFIASVSLGDAYKHP